MTMYKLTRLWEEEFCLGNQDSCPMDYIRLGQLQMLAQLGVKPEEVDSTVVDAALMDFILQHKNN